MEKTKFILEFEKPIRALEEQLEQLRQSAQDSKVDFTDEIRSIEGKLEETRRTIFNQLTAWQKVQIARHPKRPYTLDYIHSIFTDFQELHGDRAFRDDQALIGGTAWLDERPVMLIGQQKGRDTKENIMRNFGMPNPEGYRKALRLMQLAERFKLPIFTFIDTAGAYPGIGSEERHVSEAIATNLREMSSLEVPVIATIIGEGGSGGALGVAVANRVLILQNAYYSVISPEGCAGILWRDRLHAPTAAEALKFTADELLKLGAVDQVIDEPLGGAHLDPDTTARNLRQALTAHLAELDQLSSDELLEQRYQKFRNIGVFNEQ